MTADLLAFLRATLDAAQAEAEAARSGSDGVWSRDGWPYEGAPTREQADHIVRHAPAAVLRRIAADRKMLELHAAVPDHGRYSERGCAENGCDGDHNEPPVCRSCRTYTGDSVETPCDTIRLLAEGWGWTEGV